MIEECGNHYQKRFFSKDGVYFYTYSNPVYDITTERYLNSIDRFKKQFDKLHGKVLTRSEILFYYGCYKKHFPVAYFGDILSFNDNYKGDKSDIVIHAKYSSIKNANQFFEKYEEKFPDIRKKLRLRLK